MKRWIAFVLIFLSASCKTANFRGGVARSETAGKTNTPGTDVPTDPITGKPIDGSSNLGEETPTSDNPDGTDNGNGDPKNPDNPNNPNNPNNPDNPNDPNNPDDPFVEITKLGVNFEDRPGTDDDYNDAVLCFKGAFKINRSHLISIKKQDLIATTSSISLCKHNIEVKIFDKNKKLTNSKTYDTKTKNEVKMRLLEGDELEINMIPYEGCGAGQVRSMRDARFAKILKDECRTTGQ